MFLNQIQTVKPTQKKTEALQLQKQNRRLQLPTSLKIVRQMPQTASHLRHQVNHNLETEHSLMGLVSMREF